MQIACVTDQLDGLWADVSTVECVIQF